MKKIFGFVIALLLSLSLTSCARNAVASETPVHLDFSVAEDGTMENVDGCFLTIRYPVIKLGYAHWDGAYRNGEGHDALSDALDAYNTEIRTEQEAFLNHTLRPAVKQMAGEMPEELYSHAEVYVTRSDELVVAFYESVTNYTGELGQQDRRRTFNFDVKTGKKLKFEDVFTDTGKLSELLAAEFAAADKSLNLKVNDALAEKIVSAIQEDNGQVCFALSNGGVHFFAERNLLNGRASGIVHVMLSLDKHAELVKNFYRPAAENWMTRLEYDTQYRLPGYISLRMKGVHEMESDSVKWSVTVNGKTLTEELYGYNPKCWLIHAAQKNFLYMEPPAGDVSYSTIIYEIGTSGVKRLDDVGYAMYGHVNHNPERLLMINNDYVYSGNIILMTYGVYRVGKDGLPVPVNENEFGLTGLTLRLTKAAKATAADKFNPNRENGTMQLKAGTKLTPFRTDRESYLDFFDAKGNVCRFAIDGFTGEMNLNGFGTLEDLLEPVFDVD